MKILQLSLLTIFGLVRANIQTSNLTKSNELYEPLSEFHVGKRQLMAKRPQKRTKTLEEIIDREQGWMNAFLKHMALYKGLTFKLGEVAVNAHLYGMAAALIFRALKGAKNGKGGVFEKIRSKLDKRVRYHINKEKLYHAKNVYRHKISKIVVKMHWRREGKQYKYEDLLDLRSYLVDMFPFDPSVDYDEEWFVIMAKYLMLYKSFYNGLIENRVVHKCVWVKDWNSELKSSLKKAITRLSYAYFSHLEKKELGARKFGRTWLSFVDNLSEPSKLYSKIPYTEVKEKVLGDLSYRVAATMMAEIGNSYNTLVSDEDLTECGLDAQNSKLTDENVFVEYPKSCYGIGKGEKQCDLPCGKYDWSEPWCPYFHGGAIEDNDINIFSTSDNNIKGCDDSPDIWRSCAKIEEIPDVESWDNVMTKVQKRYTRRRSG